MQSKELEKAEKPKKTKAQRARQGICLTLTVIFAVVTGFYAGNLYVAKTIAQTDYSAFTEEDLLDDPQPLIKKAANGAIPSDFTATEAFVLADYNLNNCDHFIKTEMGSFSHKFGEQFVYNYRYKYNNKQCSIDISKSSMLSVAKKMLVDDNGIRIYTGKVTSKTEADWATEYSSYDSEGVKKLRGVSENQILPYIVSSKTVVEQTEAKLVDNGVWEYTIVLNNDSAFVRYNQQIKFLGGIDSDAHFSKFNITFRVDKNFNFVEMTTTEVYDVVYAGAIPVTCSGSMHHTYDFATIPEELF